MVKLHAARSKRVSSRHRHKVERKKREHKRDLRKAAKALRKSGRAPARSKKSRDMARAALRVSNAHADKEQILAHILEAREHARVAKAEARRKRKDGEGDDAATTGDDDNDNVAAPRATPSAARNLLYIPVRDSNNFAVQFTRALHELVFPLHDTSMQLPASAFVVTLDVRFAVACLPVTLLDALVTQASLYTGGTHQALVLFVLTKCDLVSAPTIVTQVSLLAHALHTRYAPHGLGRHLVATIAAHSVHHPATSERLCRILHQWQTYAADARKAAASTAASSATNMDGKVCTFVLGLPNTGRRSLCRALASEVNEARVSVVPLRAAQLQLRRTAPTTTTAHATATDAIAATTASPAASSPATSMKLALPNAKAITLVQLPECAELRKQLARASGCDVLLRSLAYIEKLDDPETPACVLYTSIADKVALAQAFCQPMRTTTTHANTNTNTTTTTTHAQLHAARQFLRGVGTTLRREKGLRVSSLFVSGADTMGRVTSSSLTAHADFTSGQQRSQATLLDVTYSNATPSKLVRIAATVPRAAGARRRRARAQRPDARNVLRLGARTFLRELCRGGNVPWAVMRATGDVPLTPTDVAAASRVFDAALCSGRRPRNRSDVHKRNDDGNNDDDAAHLQQIVQALSAALKSMLPLLPNNVVEMSASGLAFPQYKLDNDEEDGEEDEKEDDDEDEAGEHDEDDEDEEDEESDDDEDDDEDDDDEDEEDDDDDDDE